MVKKDSEIIKSISRTIFGLNLNKNTSFYSLYLMMIDKIVDESISTMAVGSNNLSYALISNPYYWESLSDVHKKSLLLHEVSHMMFNHVVQSQSYGDKELFNKAADIYINHILQEEGHTFPADNMSIADYTKKYGPLMEDLYKRKPNMSDEEFNKEFYSIPLRGIFKEDYGLTKQEVELGTNHIYNKILEIEKRDKKAPNQDIEDLLKSLNKSGKDVTNSTSPISKEKMELIESQNDYYLKECAKAEKEANKNLGNIPAHLKGIIDKLLNPVKPIINWKNEFKNWVGGFGRKSIIAYTRLKPNLIIEGQPKTRLKRNKHIALAWDTSGSVSKEELVRVAQECLSIKKFTKDKFTVIECDAHVDPENGVYELKNKEQIEQRFKSGLVTGGGGTSVDPIIEYLKDRPDITGLIYFTDGYLREPVRYPLMPFLTVLTSKGVEKKKLKWKCKVLKIND